MDEVSPSSSLLDAKIAEGNAVGDGSDEDFDLLGALCVMEKCIRRAETLCKDRRRCEM